jgi:hypothetical protein
LASNLSFELAGARATAAFFAIASSAAFTPSVARAMVSALAPDESARRSACCLFSRVQCLFEDKPLASGPGVVGGLGGLALRAAVLALLGFLRLEGEPRACVHVYYDA